MSPDVRQSRLTEPTDAQLAEYRSISGWAVVGLIFGLLSPLALAGPLLWAVPLAGLIICGRALLRIRQNASNMIGRKAALAGLWLAVFSLAAVPSDLFYYRWRISGEATQVGLFWFELLAKNRPEMAFQLTLSPTQRRPLDERIWDFYVDVGKNRWRTALKNYVAPAKPDEPPQLVRTLLALGDSAEVRYLSTLNQANTDSDDLLDQLYAVTFNESGEKKTFLVTIRLVHARISNNRAAWRIVNTQGGVDLNGQKPS